MIVINGEKYTSICKVFTSKTKAQYDANITSYGHTICVKNVYILTLVQANPLTSPSAQVCAPVCNGRISNNLAFYDEVNGKELTQSDMRTLYSWLDNSSPNWWLSQGQLSIDYLKSELIANERELNTRSEFSTYGGTFFNTANFNYYNYVDLQYSPLFDNVYLGYLRTLSNGARARLEYDIVSGVDVVASFNDLKISQSMWYKHCVLSQELNGKIDNTVFAIDWKVYIDGTTNPNVEIAWKSDYLNFDETGNKFDLAFAIVKIGESPAKLISFESGVYSTSYKKILKDFSHEWYTKFVECIASIFDLPMVTVELIGVVRNGTTDVFSGLCKLYLSPNGTASGTVDIGRSDTITIISGNGGSGGSGGSDENSPEPSENDSPDNPNEPSVNSLSLLTTTYAMTPQRLQQFGSFLWDSSFIDKINLINNSPIENVVSCKLFPLTIGGGSDVDIILGNVASGVNGRKVTSGTFNFKRNITGFTVNQLFGNFLDFEPFTRISIYLPFIGLKELQPSQIIGKVVSLSYVIDLITGVCKCIVYASGKQISDYDGAIGIDIPITSNNRAQVELSYISSALGVVGSIAMGSPLGVVGSVLSGASASHHSQTQGTSSPCTGVYNSLTPFMIFDRPKYTIPSAYGRTKGFVCNKSKSIVSCSGFTVCHENVDLSGISCTNEELQEIKQLLTSGIFV